MALVRLRCIAPKYSSCTGCYRQALLPTSLSSHRISTRKNNASTTRPTTTWRRSPRAVQEEHYEKYSTPRVRYFHSTPKTSLLKSVVLADIGEGTTEAQIVQWFVKEGASIKEWDALCEVTTDKANTEVSESTLLGLLLTQQISSKYTGVIKKLHYQKDEEAVVGLPLYDIDVEEEETDSAPASSTIRAPTPPRVDAEQSKPTTREESFYGNGSGSSYSNASLATPAVRHVSKELGIDISKVTGTGKDGRVMKEDLHRFQSLPSTTTPSASAHQDVAKPLTPFQTGMFKTMTNSLSIPHFLFTDIISLNSLSAVRKALKSDPIDPKSISPFPFLVKAISLALNQFPLLNSHLDTKGSSPLLTQRSNHDFGIAIDTPAGLVVPVLRNVQSKSVTEIATGISELAVRARTGKLTSSDLKGATFTISNVGSLAGGVVAPVITAPQVGIVGIGKARTVPAFDTNGKVVQREEVTLSWSADHRVVDGAMVARAAVKVQELVEDVGKMLIDLH
jgi:2-oxoisovalerate dehydrogenase E2 component (dihydrolipoyl transacylase)